MPQNPDSTQSRKRNSARPPQRNTQDGHGILPGLIRARSRTATVHRPACHASAEKWQTGLAGSTEFGPGIIGTDIHLHLAHLHLEHGPSCNPRSDPAGKSTSRRRRAPSGCHLATRAEEWAGGRAAHARAVVTPSMYVRMYVGCGGWLGRRCKLAGLQADRLQMRCRQMERFEVRRVTPAAWPSGRTRTGHVAARLVEIIMPCAAGW